MATLQSVTSSAENGEHDSGAHWCKVSAKCQRAFHTKSCIIVAAGRTKGPSDAGNKKSQIPLFLHEVPAGSPNRFGNQGLVSRGGIGAKSGSPKALEAAATGELDSQGHSYPVQAFREFCAKNFS